jgi:periplasmic divalent cation tolerance protein
MNNDISAYAVVQTTVNSLERANTLAAEIVAARLAACVQVAAITSHYRWNGELRAEPEYLLSAKTRRALFGHLSAFIRARHAYEVPEVIQLPISDGSPEYLAWIDRETQDPSEPPPRDVT